MFSELWVAYALNPCHAELGQSYQPSKPETLHVETLSSAIAMAAK